MKNYIDLIGISLFFIVMYLEYKGSTNLQRNQRRPKAIAVLILGMIAMSILGYYFLRIKQDIDTLPKLILVIKYSCYLFCFGYLLRFIYLSSLIKK